MITENLIKVHRMINSSDKEMMSLGALLFCTLHGDKQDYNLLVDFVSNSDGNENVRHRKECFLIMWKSLSYGNNGSTEQTLASDKLSR